MSNFPKSYILGKTGVVLFSRIVPYAGFPFLLMFVTVQKTVIFHQAFLPSTLSLFRICKNIVMLLVVFKEQVDGK